MGQDCGLYSDFAGGVYFEEVACGSGRLVELAQDSVCAVLNI